jgi:hypothetical protein
MLPGKYANYLIEVFKALTGLTREQGSGRGQSGDEILEDVGSKT